MLVCRLRVRLGAPSRLRVRLGAPNELQGFVSIILRLEVVHVAATHLVCTDGVLLVHGIIFLHGTTSAVQPTTGDVFEAVCTGGRHRDTAVLGIHANDCA